MTTITYTVAGTGTTADGSIATFDIVPNRDVLPVRLTPVMGFARAGTVVQKTTTEIERRITISQDSVPETELPEWERFFTSQYYSNEPFELDALDVPGIRSLMQCHLEPQDYAPSFFACNHYTQSFNAIVVQ